MMLAFRKPKCYLVLLKKLIWYYIISKVRHSLRGDRGLALGVCHRNLKFTLIFHINQRTPATRFIVFCGHSNSIDSKLYLSLLFFHRTKLGRFMTYFCKSESVNIVTGHWNILKVLKSMVAEVLLRKLIVQLQWIVLLLCQEQDRNVSLTYRYIHKKTFLYEINRWEHHLFTGISVPKYYDYSITIGMKRLYHPNNTSRSWARVSPKEKVLDYSSPR